MKKEIEFSQEDLKLSKFDPVDYLNTLQDIKYYLEEAFNSGDPSHIADAIGDALRAYSGMTKTSQKTGLDRSNLYSSFSPKGDPRLSTLLKVISSLGLKLSITSKTNL